MFNFWYRFVILDTIRKAKLFSEFDEIRYMLFSRSGFTEELRVNATSRGDITLIGVEELFSVGDQ